MKTLKNVKFECKDHKELNLNNPLIYCGPQYRGTTPYEAVGDFDSEEFWRIMKKNGQKEIL